MASKKKATAISLPLSRTAKIMTSAVGIESVNPDIVALATKATEIFLMDFARRAYDQNSDEEFRSNVLEYDDIQKLVYSDSRYDFLTDTIPKRIKFSEALELVEKANKQKEETDRELQAAAERAKELKEARAKQKLLKEAEEEKVAKKAKLEQQVDGNQEQKQKQKHVKATNDEEKDEENDENEVDEKSDVEQSLNDKE